MKANEETDLLKFAQTASKLAKRAVPPYSCKFSRKDYTQRQHAVLCCLKVKLEEDYRELHDLLVEMPRVREALDLQEVPHFTTPEKFFDRMSLAVWRLFLQASGGELPRNQVTSTDSSGFERNHASRYYTKRAGLKIQNLKVTMLVDIEENVVLDLYLTTTRKHDTQIAPSLLRRNSSEMEVSIEDKGFDDSSYREECREYGIRPIIKHREFTALHRAWNSRLDQELYGQRSQSETVNSTIKRKYGSHVCSRVWYRQFRGVVVKCVVHNLEKVVKNLSLKFLENRGFYISFNLIEVEIRKGFYKANIFRMPFRTKPNTQVWQLADEEKREEQALTLEEYAIIKSQYNEIPEEKEKIKKAIKVGI